VLVGHGRVMDDEEPISPTLVTLTIV
jgi:hypothetical protein